MTTDHIKTTLAAQAAAISSLLFEFDSLTGRDRARLRRRYSPLIDRLTELATAARVHHDAIYVDAAERLQKSQELEDGLTCVALIAGGVDDGEWMWVHFPEATHAQARGEIWYFMRDDGTGNLGILRTLPITHVHEVRNVPKGHPFLDQCKTWTVDNQGEELFRAEMDATREQAREQAVEPIFSSESP